MSCADASPLASRTASYRRSYQASEVLSVTIVVAAAAQAVLFAVFLARTIILRPFSDMISWIDVYLQARQQHGGLLEYLWAPNNEHHMPIIRLLTALDISTFHASGVPFVIAATTALVAAALLIFRELYRDRHLTGPLRLLALLGPMLLLTSAAAVDCSIPITSVYPLALVCVIAALVLFDGEAERTRLTDAKRIAAVVMAVMASLSNAVGMVVWPGLLWSAWRAARPRDGCSRLLQSALATGLPMRGLSSDAFEDPSHLTSFAHLTEMAVYLLTYLGLPWSRAAQLHLPALVLGGAMVVAGSVVIVRDTLLKCQTTRLQRIAVAWVIAALAAALLAAAGRVDVAPEVPLRYALLIAPLHIGLLALVLSFFANRVVTPRQQTTLLCAGALFAAGLVALPVAAGRFATGTAATIAATIDLYDAGIREPCMEKLIYPDLAIADRVLEALHHFVAARQ